MDPVETLQRLISIPSQNPMGSGRTGPDFFETRLTDHLQQLADRLGWDAERHPVHPGRDNLLLSVPGADPAVARLLLFEVHQDTVPVDGMTIDPFAGQLKHGRVYGRGACDVKGSMACMLAALVRLKNEEAANRPTVVLALTVNEEHGFTGATALRRLWESGDSRLLPRSPDAIVVAEPTELNVVATHKGVLRWRCRTHGRAAHSSDPSRGENAIYNMARVLSACEGLAAELSGAEPDPQLGRPTLSVGTISGGISVNTVPDACTIEIDRRLLPRELPEVVFEQLTAEITARSGVADLEHEPPLIVARGLSADGNAELAEQVARQARATGTASQVMGVPFGTNASAYAGVGVPVVVFGPGSIAQAHTRDEWIAVDQLGLATEAYFRIARSFHPSATGETI